MTRVAVIIPAKDEARSIGEVLQAIPSAYRNHVIVVDNASADRTSEIATAHNAVVLRQRLPGYGNVMLKGIDYLRANPPDIVVFLDGDFSDYPEYMPDLVQPIERGECDMVLSTRLNPLFDRRSLPLHVVWGNRFCVMWINFLFAAHYTDLGPFRAIGYHDLTRLRMCDPNYGWTAEMQIKARRCGLRVKEVPVRYRRRVGKSKISGTLRGSVRAGLKILYTIFCLYLLARRDRSP